MQPLVSVVIPTYNHEKYISEAIESILAQTYQPLEIIIIDDGSTDRTREILCKYLDRVSYYYQDNKGLSAARNTGIRLAKSTYIAFLDADDIWLPTKLEKQMQVTERRPELGLVSCGGYFADERGNIIDEIKRDKIKDEDELLKKLGFKNCISGGSNIIVKMECFNKVGFFDENLRSAEDWDMWLRISSQYAITSVQEPLVLVRLRENSMSACSNADRMLKNELIVLQKVFSDSSFDRYWKYKRQIYSFRYLCAARSFYSADNRHNTFLYLLKAFLSHPIYAILNKTFIALLVRLLLGKRPDVNARVIGVSTQYVNKVSV